MMSECQSESAETTTSSIGPQLSLQSTQPLNSTSIVSASAAFSCHISYPKSPGFCSIVASSDSWADDDADFMSAALESSCKPHKQPQHSTARKEPQPQRGQRGNGRKNSGNAQQQLLADWQAEWLSAGRFACLAPENKSSWRKWQPK